MSRCTAPAAMLLLFAIAPLWAGGGGEAPRAQAGGTLVIGAQPLTNLDPHFATSISDIQLLEQVYEHLTFIGASNRPAPDLAESWESAEGKTWTFTLREGARFSSGKLVTARDVVASFDRLRDPKVGTPAAALFKNIREVQADSYLPDHRVVLKRNPHHNVRDSSGAALPYLEEIRMIFSPDLNGQVEALRRGELGYLGGLTTEIVKGLAGSGGVKILSVDSNMHWAIHQRSDRGPAADNRVRQALKLATNHQALIDAIRPGLASVGNGFTPVGPVYGRYHLVRPPFMNPAKARSLLAEAGYPDGLKIVLHAQNQLDAVPIAAIWKEQLARIGVEVQIRVIPSETYYGGGEQDWLKVDFGITDWGARATPLSYFKLAYATGAPWNESHWSDPAFDELIAGFDREMSEVQRVGLYHQAQEILIERGPLIVPYFVKAVAGVRSDLRGVSLASDWPRTRFRDAYFDR